MNSKYSNFPDMPHDGGIAFHILLYLYGLISMAIQYVNIYRTVWWLPHSHALYGLNLDMIDFPLLWILVLIMTIKFLSFIFIQLWTFCGKSPLQRFLSRIGQAVLALGFGFSLTYITYHILNTYSVWSGLFLCYPVLVYVMLFWSSMKRRISEFHLVRSKSDTSTRKQEWNKANLAKYAPMRHSVVPPPCPSLATEPGTTKPNPATDCSIPPELIRNDIEKLKTDFNARLKAVLFHSLTTAYYMCVVPVFFTQAVLHYDLWWIIQHVIIVWLTAFIYCVTHYLPPAYIDSLHQQALFLGRWKFMHGRNAHVPYTAWSELQAWPQGAMVKHVKGLFKAVGIHNTAEPGNHMHVRFYLLFGADPLRMCNWLCGLAWCLVVYQLAALIQSTEWNHIFNITLLLFSCYFLLFRLMRDRFVLTRIYAESRYIKMS